MTNFNIGDVCVGQNFVRDTSYNGKECTVLGFGVVDAYCTITDQLLGPMALYKVEWFDSSITYQDANELRLKKPPTAGEEIIRAMFQPQPEQEPV